MDKTDESITMPMRLASSEYAQFHVALFTFCVLSAEVSTSEDGTISHEADQAIYKSSAGTLDEQIARWEKSAEARAAANAASAYRSTTSSTTSTTASGYGRAAAPTLNIGGGGAARQATRTETVRTTSTSTSGGGVGGVQVTPEGYVLVPASSARAAGIAGRQVSANTASNLGLPSTSGFRSTGRVSLTTAPLRSTTTVTRTQTSRTGSTNRAIGGISTAGGYSTTALDGGVQYQPVDGAEAIEEAN